MARSYPLYNNIEISGIAAEGKAIARYEGKVIFIPYAVPGDIVDVQIVKNRRDYMEGYIKNIITPSPYRITPFCSHFGICGGCKWQSLPYEKQLLYKQQQVIDQFTRIGKIPNLKVSDIAGAKETTCYRNKLEFTFSDKRWMTQEELHTPHNTTDPCAAGFHIPGMFDKVLDLDTCYLQPQPSNDIRLAIKKYAIRNKLSFFNIRRQSGFLRTLIIRNTISSGEVMVIVVLAEDTETPRIQMLQYLQQQFPTITSLCYIINTKRNDSIQDLDVHLFSGKDYMEEQLDDLLFKISPKSFFQTNTAQAVQLYRMVHNFAKLAGNETVYDLYTGAGSIALYLARHARHVIGIEYVADAVANAKENARRNHINNAEFFAGDMKNILTTDFFALHGQPDVIILDPPRAGIHSGVAHQILHSGAQRLVYVSCNPATQARDMSLLAIHYQITHIQPVDMFPHTHHVENIVAAEKIS